MAWQVQEAKQKFSELVERAITDGPQTISRRGVDVAVVVSIEEYLRLTDRKPSLAEFLLSESGPYFDDLVLERSQEFPRVIDW